MKLKTRIFTFLTLTAPLLISFAVSACNDGVMEEAGEDVDEAVEDVKDATDG
jgi:predicted small secreted protein